MSDKKPEPKKARAKSPTRVGKIGIVGYFSPELSIRLNILRAQEQKTLQALLGEAIDLLLENRGQKRANER